MTKIRSFHEFWPVYLAAHRDPRCRALHYCASFAGLASLDAALATGQGWWLAAGLIAAYAFAWAGHFFVERNAPLMFRYPLWSFVADYRMFLAWLSGHLAGDLARLDGSTVPVDVNGAQR